jgi:integrase
MPRPHRSAKLDSRAARQKLPMSGKPIYTQIGRGLHLGYRKNKGGGRWVMRQAKAPAGYRVEVIGEADDILSANGRTVLDFFQASRKAQELAKTTFHSVNREAASYTLRMCFEDYFQAMFHRLKTAKEAKSRVAALIMPHLGDRPVAQLSAEEIRAWHNLIATSPPLRRAGKNQARQVATYDPCDPEAVRRRKSSANRLLTMLKAALNHAFQERYVSEDQAWRRVKPFPNVDSARTRYLDKNEISRVMAGLSGAFGNLVRAALYTGARYGDLARLRILDFDAASLILLIARPKGDKARKVHLTDEGAAFFEAICRGRKSGDIMFAQENGRPWKPSDQQRPMAALTKAAQLSEPVRFHELRHTYASHAAMNGMQLLVLAQNLGHVDTRMVEKHYGHLSDQHKREMIRQTGLQLTAE